MPVITAISQQRRRADRFSIYLDGKYRFSLGQNQLVDAGLRVGDEVSEDELAGLERRSEEGKALDRAYNYLSLRPRSRREMAQYFRRKQYDDDMAAALLQRLEDQDLINDQRFARVWVDDRQTFSPRSRVQLQSELRAKGIDSQTIDIVLAELKPGNEEATIKQLIITKQLQRRYPDQQKLTRHLVGKGFHYAAITAALQELEDSN